MPVTLWPCTQAVLARCRFLLPALILTLMAATGGCRKNPDEQAAPLLKEVETALSQQKWEMAQEKAQEAVRLPGLSEALRDQVRLKEEQARSEQQAKSQYARFVGNVDTDHDTAVSAYRDLPATSYYRQQGKDAYDKLRPIYISEHIEKAQAALTNGRCDDAKTQFQLVMEVDGANARALELSKMPCDRGAQPR